MASTKGRIVRSLSNIALKRATVVARQDIGGFARLLLKCDMRGLTAGMKVQLLLPSTDMRTYTPIPTSEGIVLLGWKHARGPGADWMTDARVGEVLPFMGPQRSLQLEAGPVIVVGDETSVAVAASFGYEREGNVRAVIQSLAEVDVKEVATSFGLHDLSLVAPGDINATVEAVVAYQSEFPNAVIALTGGSELVFTVRNALRQAGITNIKSKTYWIPGKAGLD